MRMVIGALALLAASADLPRMDATHLPAGTTCYAIVRNGAVVGSTWQRLQPTVFDGRPVWDVVVHQRVAAMRFDMRDHFVLDRHDLSPIAMDSRRDVAGNEAARQVVAIRYAPTRVYGTKLTAGATTTINVTTDHRVWDGNLWGVTFAALPLRAGTSLRLPFWQYDKGFGTFDVRVTGSESVRTPSGPVDAWTLEVTDAPGETATYLIGKKSRMEMGYRMGPAEQHIGGNCQGMD